MTDARAPSLDEVRARIARAAAARGAGRVAREARGGVEDASGPEAVREAYAAGQRAFGENYAQELATQGAGAGRPAGHRVALHRAPADEQGEGGGEARARRAHGGLGGARARARQARRRSEARVAPLPVLIEVSVGGEAQKAGGDAERDRRGDARRAGAAVARAARPHDDAAGRRPGGGAARLRDAGLAAQPARRRRRVLPELSMGMSERPRGRHRVRRHDRARRNGDLRRAWLGRGPPGPRPEAPSVSEGVASACTLLPGRSSAPRGHRANNRRARAVQAVATPADARGSMAGVWLAMVIRGSSA